MSEETTMAETARKIVADLTGEKEQITATIDGLLGKLDGLKAKQADIDSAISILVDTYKIKTRPSDMDSVKPAPATRGRKKNVEVSGKKKKPIEIKAAVRQFIAGTLEFQVKTLVTAVREVRPDAQQPSIQAELTKLMKAGELSRIGYGKYQSNVYTGAPVDVDESESEASPSGEDEASPE